MPGQDTHWLWTQRMLWRARELGALPPDLDPVVIARYCQLVDEARPGRPEWAGRLPTQDYSLELLERWEFRADACWRPFHFWPGQLARAADGYNDEWTVRLIADSALLGVIRGLVAVLRVDHLLDGDQRDLAPAKLGLWLHVAEDLAHAGFSGDRAAGNAIYPRWHPRSLTPDLGHAEDPDGPDDPFALWCRRWAWRQRNRLMVDNVGVYPNLLGEICDAIAPGTPLAAEMTGEYLVAWNCSRGDRSLARRRWQAALGAAIGAAGGTLEWDWPAADDQDRFERAAHYHLAWYHGLLGGPR
jgi:hypothetical protein